MKSSKHVTLFVLILLTAFFGSARGEDYRLDSQIKEVTMYSDRALVVREAQFNVAPGLNLLEFGDIPEAAEESSLRATLTATNARIIGLSLKSSKITGNDDRRKKLHSQLDTLWTNVYITKNRIAVLEKQKQMLEQLAANAAGSSDAGSPDAQRWEAAYANVGRHMFQILDSLRIIKLREEQTRALCNSLERELIAIDSTFNRRVKAVLIEVESAANVASTVRIEYLVANTSWKPIYNVRLVDSGIVEVQYLAEIFQNAGEDWNDVNLILSTAQPRRTTAPSELPSRVISVIEPQQIEVATAESQVITRRGLLQPDATANVRSFEMHADSVDTPADLHPTGLVGFDATSSAYSTRLVLSRTETVRAGDRPSRVVVAVWRLSGEETLIARAQREPNAFRSIKLKNDSETPFLPGEMNLFAGGDYIGKYYSAYYISPQQEFNLGFGIDDRIAVKREVRDRKVDVDDDKRKLSETVSISLINHSEIARTVSVEEALPYSADSRIKVVIKSSNPKPKSLEAMGKTTWEVKLKPSEKAVVEFQYEVEYPSDMSVSGL